MNISFPDGYRAEPPTDSLLDEIANRLCQADKSEVAASTDLSVEEALRQGAAMSYECHVVSYKGVPLFVGGLCILDHQTASPWQLCTSEAKQHARVLLKTGKRGLAHWLNIRPKLINLVDSRNRESMAWLAWLGFAFGEPVVLPGGDVPFIPFSMLREEKNV